MHEYIEVGPVEKGMEQLVRGLWKKFGVTWGTINLLFRNKTWIQ